MQVSAFELKLVLKGPRIAREAKLPSVILVEIVGNHQPFGVVRMLSLATYPGAYSPTPTVTDQLPPLHLAETR